MKEKYIADDKITLNVQNLRWVRKRDTQYSGCPVHYELVLCYNAKSEPILTVDYKKQKNRDAMFDRVSEYLCEKKTAEGQ